MRKLYRLRRESAKRCFVIQWTVLEIVTGEHFELASVGIRSVDPVSDRWGAYYL